MLKRNENKKRTRNKINSNKIYRQSPVKTPDIKTL